MKLYTFFRSSAAYRVRIALALKGLEYESIPIHLRKNQQNEAAYKARNPSGLVPVLEDKGLEGNTESLSQSLAIIEYLDETYPAAPLLPRDPLPRAKVQAFAQMIACDIHPLNNLRVLQYLTKVLGLSEAQKNEWIHHWIHQGFSAIETILEQNKIPNKVQDFCFGNHPSLADCCLIPQVYNAERFEVKLDAYPLIRHINEFCLQLPAFKAAHPAAQIDSE